MQRFTLPSPRAIDAIIGRSARVHFELFDSPTELADDAIRRGAHRVASSWLGMESSASAAHKARHGDASLVAASEALMARFETFAFETSRKAWANDVAGSFPDVQAFIAGHPLSMRRRIKVAHEAGPIAIVADLTTSAGIKADAIARRGAAILALVRIMSTRRPVELWAGVALDADSRANAVAIFTRIETAPLDVSQAAFVLTSAGFPRALCYEIGKADHNFCGGWPFGRHVPDAETMPAILAPAFPHLGETLCIPPAHMDDQIHLDPEGWIAAKLAEASTDALTEAA